MKKEKFRLRDKSRIKDKSVTRDKNKMIKMAIVISTALVLFIPMLYSTIYLGAFWDPYEKLDSVPIAIVNLDKEVVKDGKVYDIGEKLTKNLKENKKMNWKFVDAKSAKKGLNDSSYYATITVPEDFSKTISEVNDGKDYDAKIIYSANKGKNFIFSQLSQKAAENIKFEISSNIQQEISKTLIDNMYTIKDSLREAEEGSEKLTEGSEKLSKGSEKLTKGTIAAHDGSMKLESGLKSASDGSKKLDSGINKLKSGGDKLSKGAEAASEGSKKLSSGLNDLSAGEQKVADGSGELVKGLETLKNSLVTPNENVAKLVAGASAVSDYNTKLAKGTEQLNNTLDSKLNAAADNLKAAGEGIDGISSGLQSEIQNIDASDMNSDDKQRLKNMIMSLGSINDQMKAGDMQSSLREVSKVALPLKDGMNQLSVESKAVSNGVSALAEGLNETQQKARVGVDQLLSGAKEIKNGSDKLLVGINTASSKTGELSSGMGSLYEGTVSLSDGLSSAQEGSSSLEKGLDTAYSKTGELSKGLSALNSGSKTLKDGISTLDEGSIKLRDGLKNGYQELDQKLTFNATDMASFMANPVSIQDKSINDVNHYGEGLAPYFVSLSLWLGAMFINLIISIAKKFNKGKYKKMNGFFRSFIAGGILVMIQSVILSISLVTILKLTAVSMSGFFLCNMFISLVFFSLMYGVSHAIGIIGTPIMFVFFLVQISSAGGTFPIETAPAFYRAISRLIPMTYSVGILRMMISGINSTLFNSNMIVLTEFIIGSLIGGFVLRKIVDWVKSSRIKQKTIE